MNEHLHDNLYASSVQCTSKMQQNYVRIWSKLKLTKVCATSVRIESLDRKCIQKITSSSTNIIVVFRCCCYFDCSKTGIFVYKMRTYGSATILVCDTKKNLINVNKKVYINWLLIQCSDSYRQNLRSYEVNSHTNVNVQNIYGKDFFTVHDYSCCSSGV